ncbi:TetR/AcrR family transcriptional regulator [Salinibacterium sp. M195]|uniref:TetR/AcrR family transcriptional regulator n=1 Tax=Salinibacterium sp. M195 TaxID=2583374 RepID=UPI001C6293AB|nr:TetR/AcrR family transcriptional regulator [Salinibacterium sp. M195]QYH34781.1 TetR/AcrR family transcriptional regulator [Salinibacterium sp. M195]
MSRSEPAYHHGNLGPTLENAALELLRSQGHASLSLREVARVAGVSHNAPYHHFGDRSALLKRLSERSMAELLSALRAAEEQREKGQNSQGQARAHAVAIGVAYVGYAAEFPERFRLIYDPNVCIPGSPSAAMKPLLEQVEEILATTTAALLPGGPPVAMAALVTAVWGAVHGLAELVVAGHISFTNVEPALIALFGVSGN